MSTVKTIATYPQGGTGTQSLGTANQVLATNSGATGLEWQTVQGVPTGSVTAYAAAAAPSGWLLCDGSAVSQATYAALYAVVGVSYGDPGSGNFNLPNLKGRMPVGRDSGQTEFDTLAETGGAKTHTLSTAEMPSHTHSVVGNDNSGTARRVYLNADNETRSSGNTGSAGSGTAHNNLQPYLVMNYIIKT